MANIKNLDYSRLATEQANRKSSGLDKRSSKQIVALMNREDQRVVKAVKASAGAIAQGADLIAASLRAGGHVYLVGAGTSGRLAVLEAAECPPTFNTDRVHAIMAGGKQAVFRSQEGAEDQEAPARQAIQRSVTRKDIVVGIAASGVTAFVGSALKEARRRGAKTILVTCNPKAIAAANIKITLNVGPEVLTGSTRLKSGTACKMALNMLTTASMVRWGKVYDHWMVDLQPKSRKLVARSLRLVKDLGEVSEEKARELLQQAGGRVKPAILMARKKIYYKQAVQQLEDVGGLLRKAITKWH
jgi:N-acetylmuramic acid 6-phosphate etherase